MLRLQTPKLQTWIAAEDNVGVLVCVTVTTKLRREHLGRMGREGRN